MAQASRDQNTVPTLLAVDATDGVTPFPVYGNAITHRLYVDLPTGTGTVTSVSVVTANGFAGTVATATTTPAITLSTTVTGILHGNGTAVAAAVVGDFPTLNQNTSGTAAIATATTITDDTTTNATMFPTWVTTASGNQSQKVSSTKFVFNPSTGRAATTALTIGNVDLTSPSATDASLDIFGTTNAIIHAQNTGAQSATGGSAIIAYAVPTGAAMLSGNRTGAFVLGGSNDATNTLANAAAITSFASENWTSTKNGANLVFEVTATAANTRQTALTLGQDKLATFGGHLVVEGVTSTGATGTGKFVFDTAPSLSGVVAVTDGATFSYIVPTVDGTASGEITSAFNSGYSSTAVGDLVILDSSATWQQTDANTASLYNGLIGIALEVKASGNAVKVLLKGYAYMASRFPTFTIGGAVYMSETAATVTQTAPVTTDSATRLLGYAVHADKMYFNPSNDWITHT